MQYIFRKIRLTRKNLLQYFEFQKLKDIYVNVTKCTKIVEEF